MISHLKTFVCICLLFLVFDASAQFGVRAKYNKNSVTTWDNYIDFHTSFDNDKMFASNLELGVDYWFRLKNQRIEFLPEIAMGLNTSTDFPSLSNSTELSYFAFNFNTQFYIFDFTGDCDCPTFSKQGPGLNKGFFISLSPGILYNTKKVTIGDHTSSQTNFRFGVGAGFDIGLSDLFTITPMVSYNLTPGVAFDDLTYLLSPNPIESMVPGTTTLNQIQFQIRFGFRPDYVKSYGRRR